MTFKDNIEFKVLPQYVKTIEGRTVTGIFAVHGNLDCYDDRSHPGSFTKTIQERGSRVKFLWSHDMYCPPVAKITNIREVTRDELPESVLAVAPDATGGVEVTREYLDTPRGNEILTAIKAGAIDEMSYMFIPIKWDESLDEATGVRIRNLREVKLLECSDVVFGANPATIASKALHAMKAVEAKAGRRNNKDDQAMIDEIVRLCYELGATYVRPTADDEVDSDNQGESRAAPAKITDALTRERRLRLVEASLKSRGVLSHGATAGGDS